MPLRGALRLTLLGLVLNGFMTFSLGLDPSTEVGFANASNVEGRNGSEELPANEPDIYVNKWALEIHGGVDKAMRVADDTGFQYVRQAECLEELHLFSHPDQPEEDNKHAVDKTELLNSHGDVQWAEQQILRTFTTRASLSPELLPSLPKHGIPYALPTDLMYKDQWYFEMDFEDPKPVWNRGFTGQGVVVAIVDDGVEHSHTDLISNYNEDVSRDFVDMDKDPVPPTLSANHGTNCAGVISAEVNNVCVAGVAYKAKFGAIRLVSTAKDIDFKVTDAESYERQVVDIYSNSWGYKRFKKVGKGIIRKPLAELGKCVQSTFEKGVEVGRDKLGSIFVWAVGKDRLLGYSCATDGFVNRVETIGVTAVDKKDQSTQYAEQCAAVMVAAYSGGADQPAVATTDTNNSCTVKFTGTSAATPMVAGVIALALQANNQLTWRDIQHILALTSQKPHTSSEMPSSIKWTTNGAGHSHSNALGFGLINSAGVVNLARYWETVPTGKVCVGEKISMDSSVEASHTKTTSFTVKCKGNQVKYIEHVVAVISARSVERGSIAFDLISPSKTVTKLLTRNTQDISVSDQAFVDWRFLTVALWGEELDQERNWELVTYANNYAVEGVSIQLEIYGTYTPPAIRSLPVECHAQCYHGCVGSAPTQCHSCTNLTVFLTDGSFDCVSKCPLGFVLNGTESENCIKQSVIANLQEIARLAHELGLTVEISAGVLSAVVSVGSLGFITLQAMKKKKLQHGHEVEAGSPLRVPLVPDEQDVA